MPRLAHPYRTGLALAAGALTAFAAWTLIGLLSGLLWCAALAAFLALGLSPIVEALHRRGTPRLLAVAAVTGGALVAVAGIVLMIVPPVVDQISQLLVRAEQFAASGALDALARDAQQFVPAALLDVRAALDATLAGLTSGATMQAVSSGVVGAGAAIGSAAFSTTAVLVLTVYFLASGRWLYAQFLFALPRAHRGAGIRAGRRAGRAVSRYVAGQLLLALLNGVLSLVILLATGSSLPVLFAVTAFVCALIPLVGIPLGAAIIVGAQALISPAPPAAWIVLAAWYVLYLFVEAYVIAPRVIGRSVGMREIVVVLVTLAGGTLYGMPGALLAVPAAVAAGATLQALREDPARRPA